jgi:hypothetical protein
MSRAKRRWLRRWPKPAEPPPGQMWFRTRPNGPERPAELRLVAISAVEAYARRRMAADDGKL